ncbi:MAG: GTPase Era [Anaerolineae bacterium]
MDNDTPILDSGWLPDDLPPDHRSGFVAVIGEPNVGKSTLMNHYLGQKVAIVSPRPQTTRQRLLGILTRPDAQVIFVDTPGIHRPETRLGEYMVEAARSAIQDADVVLWLVDLSLRPSGTAREIAAWLREAPAVVLGLNKQDLVPPTELPSRAEAYHSLLPRAEWLPLSATAGAGTDRLLEAIIARLPMGPRYFPEEQITDQQERFIVAELIREQVLAHLFQEVPHAVAVMVEEFKERREGLIYISATVYVERESQKGILIGKGGQMLRAIGAAARQEIESFLEARVYLELWSKVRKNWRKDERELRRFGYHM